MGRWPPHLLAPPLAWLGGGQRSTRLAETLYGIWHAQAGRGTATLKQSVALAAAWRTARESITRGRRRLFGTGWRCGRVYVSGKPASQLTHPRAPWRPQLATSTDAQSSAPGSDSSSCRLAIVGESARKRGRRARCTAQRRGIGHFGCDDKRVHGRADESMHSDNHVSFVAAHRVVVAKRRRGALPLTQTARVDHSRTSRSQDPTSILCTQPQIELTWPVSCRSRHS